MEWNVEGILLIKESASKTLFIGDVSLVCLFFLLLWFGTFYWSSHRIIATTREKSWQVRCQVDCSFLEIYLMSSLSIHVPHVRWYMYVYIYIYTNIYIYIYIYIYIGSLWFDFLLHTAWCVEVEHTMYRDREENRDYTFIPTSLFRDTHSSEDFIVNVHNRC